MVCVLLLSFMFHMCSLSLVLDLLFWCLNECMCCVYLCLNVPSVSPIYVSCLLLSVCVTVAWYMMLDVRHLPCRGQLLVLQLHVVCCVSGLVACCFCRTCVLWLDMICSMFCMYE